MANRVTELLKRVLLASLFWFAPSFTLAQSSLSDLIGADCPKAKEVIIELEEERALSIVSKLLKLDPYNLPGNIPGIGIIIAFDINQQLEGKRCVFEILENNTELAIRSHAALFSITRNPATKLEFKDRARKLILKNVLDRGATFTKWQIKWILRRLNKLVRAERNLNGFAELVRHALVQQSPAATPLVANNKTLTLEMAILLKHSPVSLLRLEHPRIKSVQISQFGSKAVVDELLKHCRAEEVIDRRLLKAAVGDTALPYLISQLEDNKILSSFVTCLEKAVYPNSLIQQLVAQSSNLRAAFERKAKLNCDRFRYFFTVAKNLSDTDFDKCLSLEKSEPVRFVKVFGDRTRWSSKVAQYFSDYIGQEDLTVQERLEVLRSSIRAVPFVTLRAINLHLRAISEASLKYSEYETLLPVFRKFRSRLPQILESNADWKSSSKILAVLIRDKLIDFSYANSLSQNDLLYLLRNEEYVNAQGDAISTVLERINYTELGCRDLLEPSLIKLFCKSDCSVVYEKIKSCKLISSDDVIKLYDVLPKDVLSSLLASQGEKLLSTLSNEELAFIVKDGFVPISASERSLEELSEYASLEQKEKYINLLPEKRRNICLSVRQGNTNLRQLLSDITECGFESIISDALKKSDSIKSLGEDFWKIVEVRPTLALVILDEMLKTGCFDIPVGESPGVVQECKFEHRYINSALSKILKESTVSTLAVDLFQDSTDFKNYMISTLQALSKESSDIEISFAAKILSDVLLVPSAYDIKVGCGACAI